jgi:hypothetical protein
LSSVQIVPIERAEFQTPAPRTQLAAVGAPYSLNSHCTGPAELEAEAGHVTVAAVAAVDGASAPASASAATAIRPAR